jgi:predicted nucleotidyltransferase
MLDTLTKRRLKTVVTDRAAAHLRAFRREAERALPGKIASVVLFGSRARGDARRDSDYDIAVLIRTLGDRRAMGITNADATATVKDARQFVDACKAKWNFEDQVTDELD